MYEKVNPSHPDKVADRIAGALVDMAYAQKKNPTIAVEVLIGHGRCHIITETTVRLNPREVRNAVHRIAGNVRVTIRSMLRTSISPAIRKTASAAVTTASLRVSL